MLNFRTPLDPPPVEPRPAGYVSRHRITLTPLPHTVFVARYRAMVAEFAAARRDGGRRG